LRRRSFLALAGTLPAAGRALAAGGGPVSVGLEQLAGEAGGPLRGRRVGLLCHAASVTRRGEHAIEVLRRCGVRVVRLFAPEHGLRGRAAAGQAVASGTDPRTGLPVVSLYGDKAAPSPSDLDGLDAFVIDLQDAGVRFYTYGGTALLCLRAAGEAGLAVVVLDRPNPLGGVRVDGPESDPARRPGPFALVPGPLVHGLTLGELVRHANAQRAAPARLDVVGMSGWRRGMTWPDTGRHWVAPSPNLRSAEAALAYPGTCLLEATNVSEGRGTAAPFLLVGAPWLDAGALAREAGGDGYRLEPVTFTPVASAAAPRPKHESVSCRGVRIAVVDPAAARPWILGLRLLVALRRQPQFRWARGGAALDALVATGAVRAALERGAGVAEILAHEGPALESWRERRRASLLY
jgi:uncharacterized protein YbbC (DUF1343 family)